MNTSGTLVSRTVSIHNICSFVFSTRTIYFLMGLGLPTTLKALSLPKNEICMGGLGFQPRPSLR